MAMELLQQIREAEREAEQIAARARQNGADRVFEAHKAAADKLDVLRKSRSGRISESVEQARGRAQAQAEKIRQEGKASAEALVGGAEKQTAAAVDLVVKSIRE